MKRGIVDNKVLIPLISLYIIIPIALWCLLSVYLIPIGLIAAYVIDRLTPKWAYELTWEDIDLALENLGPYGVTVSHICFRIKNRKLFVYRDKKGDPYRYVIRIPLDHWKDVYSEDEMRQILKSNGGWWSPDKFKGLKCIAYFTGKKNLEACKKVLRRFVEDSSADLKKDVLAQVDYAKKDIWVNYDTQNT